ncbi:MAG TPA: hypothetical protein VHT51_18960 [Micropepsaceae bacterium]|jgi:hypothetical protein|nr:hypothetical protein [Micropepsaceae bacterium]
MKTTPTMMSLLLLSAVCVTPAYANWFSNPRSGVMLNIGSAPNPTPADLRAIGDSNRNSDVQGTNIPHSSPNFGEPPQGRLSFDEGPKPVLHPVAKTAMANPKLTRFEGRMIFGAHGARLGTVLAVDVSTRMVDVQLPSGIAVAMPASLVKDNGRRLAAPTISPLDMMAMAKTQTGRTVAINVDTRHLRGRTSRG